MESVRACAEGMEEILDSYRCSHCPGGSFSKFVKSEGGEKTVANTIGINTISLVASDAIIGEDYISIGECIERAKNTARLARILIDRARPSVRFTLELIIDPLERKAISCCRSGGIWKGCLQPLVSKWLQWNRKWEAFRIPPDPAWDD